MEYEIFNTRDIYLASLLVTLGHELVDITFQLDGRSSRTVGIFQFESNEEVLSIEKQYLNNKELTFSPSRYVANFKNLKAKVNNTSKEI